MVYAAAGCVCVFVSDQKLCTQRHLHTVQFTQQFTFHRNNAGKTSTFGSWNIEFHEFEHVEVMKFIEYAREWHTQGEHGQKHRREHGHTYPLFSEKQKITES